MMKKTYPLYKPLTLFIIVFLCNLLLLAQVTEDVVQEESEKIDRFAFRFVERFHTDALFDFFRVYTRLGDPYVVAGLAIFLIIIFLKKGKIIDLAGLLVASIGAAITFRLGKLHFNRGRPQGIEIEISDAYSFPSGHSTIAVAFYGFLTYLLWKRFRAGRKGVLFAGCAVILLLGFSRIFLKAHFLSDVLAGYFLGMLWLLLSISIMNYLKFKAKTKPP